MASRNEDDTNDERENLGAAYQISRASRAHCRRPAKTAPRQHAIHLYGAINMGKATNRRLKKRRERLERKKQQKEKNSRHFALKNEEAVAKNKMGLSHYREESKSAFHNVVRRTEVVESAIRDEQLDAVLKRLGFELVVYHQVNYVGDGSNDDEDELKLRGGFSAKEANKQVSHAPVSIKTTTKGLPKKLVRDQYRAMIGGRDNNKIAFVYLDANGDIFFIHLMNAIPDEILTSRSRLATKLDTFNIRWSKSCGFSGRPNASHIEEDMVFNRDTRSGYFGEGSCDHVQMIGLRVTCGSTGKSSKMYYKNAWGMNRTFMCGNTILRGVFGFSNKKLPDNNEYLEHSRKMLNEVGPFIKATQSTANMSEKKLHVAYNCIPEGDPAGRAWHRDGSADCATIVSANGGDVELQSKFLNNSDAGLLAHEIGGIIHGYGKSDYLIFNGNDMHCPLPPTPAHRNRSVLEKMGHKLKEVRKGTKAQRRSFVTFYKRS